MQNNTPRYATGTRVLIVGNTDTNLHRLGEIVNDQGGWYRIRLEGDKGCAVLFRHEDLIAIVEPAVEDENQHEMQNLTAAPALHDLNVGDAVRATITGPWWTSRPLVIVELRFNGDVAVVRDAGPFGGGQVTIPADLLTRV